MRAQSAQKDLASNTLFGIFSHSFACFAGASCFASLRLCVGLFSVEGYSVGSFRIVNEYGWNL
jgi:hypothetical protein